MTLSPDRALAALKSSNERYVKIRNRPKGRVFCVCDNRHEKRVADIVALN